LLALGQISQAALSTSLAKLRHVAARARLDFYSPRTWDGPLAGSTAAMPPIVKR
jgi:hypothetical protein